MLSVTARRSKVSRKRSCSLIRGTTSTPPTTVGLAKPIGVEPMSARKLLRI